MVAGTSIDRPSMTRSIIKRYAQIGIYVVVIAAFLFLASGRLDWAWAWVYLACYVGNVTLTGLVLLRCSPETIVERAEGRANRKGWDRIVGGLMSLLMLPGTLAVAGLDFRFGWTAPYAVEVHLIALLVNALGGGLFAWAMASNPHFSPVVRIQEDRGHAVAGGGPYRYVRHPGYVGGVMGALAAPLLLGSLWALIPGSLAAALIVVRTALEDRTLQEELPGYRNYAQRVRYRLLPGIW